MKATHFHFEWSPNTPPRGFRTGVSLHSHTLHSRESLEFIYKIARHSSALRWALERGETRYRQHHGVPLVLSRGWWTPPLAPLDAYRVEAAQVESMGLRPVVSLTDHDDIEAPMSLQAVDSERQIPVSVEWTVPFGQTFFHLGLHNLPPRSARCTMEALGDYTRRPDRRQLGDLLSSLDAIPEVLVVFNHPLWDEKGVGSEVHRAAAMDLMRVYGNFLHAIEVNGLRPWRENRAAIRFAQDWEKPAVSGGDRHAVEPNAVLNLTRARTFAEFADEVRMGVSDVLITSHYRQAHAMRILHNLVDVLQPYESHGNGWREWTDRVFYHCHDNVVRSLRQLWGSRLPPAVRLFDSLVQVAANRPVRHAIKQAAARAEQVAL